MTPRVFRIQAVPSHAAGERPRGSHSTYRFHEDETPVYVAHIFPHCMKPCRFVSLAPARADDFVLRPSRRWLPMRWRVEAHASGALIGSLRRQLLGRVDWHLRDADDAPVARFVGRHDPRFWLWRFGDIFFGDRTPDGYEIVAGSTVAARMEREARAPAPDAPRKTGVRKWLGKVLVDKDWVIRECAAPARAIDPRLLYAGVVLLERISRDASTVE